MWCGGTDILCSLSLIGLLPKNKQKYGMMTTIIVTMMRLLNGAMVIKNERPKKPQ